MANNAARAEVEDEIEESSDDEQESTPKKKKTPTKRKTPKKKAKATFTTTIRFDAELVKDLIGRVIELVSVGQPDVRAAATVAAYRMGRAILDKTVLLGAKLDVAERQHAAAAKRGSPGGAKAAGGRKAESLRHQIDSLRRTRADLEEVLLGPVIQGVFIHRYRDSNMHIRQASMRTLSVMTIQRPDLFLMDKYLKYFGWMMSDKAECVREASLAGLLSPFEAVHGRGGQPPDPAVADRIDLSLMEHVSAKFLPRMADCVIDVSVRVQEKAMQLLLALLRDGFLDDVEDENIWNQINLRALARDASPAARRDALYFVMEQLEAFDEADPDDDRDEGEEEEDGAAATPSAQKQRGGQRKSASTAAASAAESSERRTVQRLDALASWTAHALTDGPIPIDKIRIDLADLVVLALRDMPEHKRIVTDWNALTRAIGDDRAATTVQGTTAGDRADVAKQRVLVRMLACAARAEVGDVTDSSFLLRDVDPDVVAATTAAAGGGGGEGGTTGRVHRKNGAGHHALSTAIQHESLSVALLKALPDLLIKFKSDSAILGSLTSLPRYLLPTVFSLPQRKGDFTNLAKNLAEIYLNSPDEKVLQNCALSMYYLTEGDHSRAPDARLQLKNVAQELQTRLLDLFAEDVSALASSKRKTSGKGAASSRKRQRTSMSSRVSSDSSAAGDDEGDEEEAKEGASEAEETEVSLYLNLKRLRVLAKRCDLSRHFGDGEDSDEADSEDDTGMEALSSVIADGLAARLKAWKVDARRDDGSEGGGEPEGGSPWDCGHQSVSKIIAGSVDEGLVLLLAVTAWKLLSVQKKESLVVPDDDVMDDAEIDDMDDVVDDHIVIRLRDRIIALCVLCYDQFLDAGDEYSSEQIAFADSVQASAGRIASDLRTLFPKEWANAASPLLRAFAMEDDGRLLSGYVRYFRSKEGELRSNEGKEKENKEVVMKLLLPIGRALATNWTLCNRREAGVVLAHLTGSGQESHQMVTALSRIFKKIEPVRLLEAHMVTLRHLYESWMENEPAEIESDRPTDAEMAAFEEEERKHGEQFEALENLASRFSQSLGVGKLSNDKLSPALLGFTQEGVKFAFSNSEDDEWALGSRLSFLNILGKYMNWIKRNKEQRAIIRHDLDERETMLREHPEFPEVHSDDIACLENFRVALGLKPSLAAKTHAESHVVKEVEEEEEMGDSVSELLTPGTHLTSGTHLTPGGHSAEKSAATSRFSRASSTRSSLRSALSPLYEDEKSPSVAGSPSALSEDVTPAQKGLHKSQATVEAEVTTDNGSEASDAEESTYSELFKARSSSTSARRS